MIIFLFKCHSVFGYNIGVNIWLIIYCSFHRYRSGLTARVSHDILLKPTYSHAWAFCWFLVFIDHSVHSYSFLFTYMCAQTFNLSALAGGLLERYRQSYYASMVVKTILDQPIQLFVLETGWFGNSTILVESAN